MMTRLVKMITLPLYVHTTKSKTAKGKAIFNLNNYRNWFPMKSNAAKKALKKHIASLKLKPFGNGPFELHYVYYHGNNRKIDVANPCSVLDKFVCDAFTELGLWPEDNVEFVHKVTYEFGGVDPNKVGYCKLYILHK